MSLLDRLLLAFPLWAILAGQSRLLWMVGGDMDQLGPMYLLAALALYAWAVLPELRGMGQEMQAFGRKTYHRVVRFLDERTTAGSGP